MDMEEMFFCVYHVEYRTSYIFTIQTMACLPIATLIIAMRFIIILLVKTSNY